MAFRRTGCRGREHADLRALTAAIATAALVTLGLSAAPDQKPPDLPAITVLVRRAADYVRAYQKDFAFLVADELYTQEVAIRGVQDHERRVIKGEMFLTFLEVDQQWVGVHDVAEVDGVAAVKTIDVRALLAQGSVRSVAPAIVASNARYNIGSVARNINQPTFALLVLSERYFGNFSFERGDVDRTRPDGVLVTLRFKEGGGSAIVRTETGKPVYSRGEITIDAETGRVVRTLVQFELGPIRAAQAATYAPDERLSLWVPTLYTETYTLNYRGRNETTKCEAIFTNYRRFAATGRIKK